MNEPISSAESLRDILSDASDNASRFIWDVDNSVCMADLLSGTWIESEHDLSGKSVLILTESQFAAALAMIELDGVARQIIIGTPDLSREHIPALLKTAGVDGVVFDEENRELCRQFDVALRVPLRSRILPRKPSKAESCRTEWVLLTSGTTGAPKMIGHTFRSLTAPIKKTRPIEKNTIWGTFYDIRRYGGLQIFLRAILGNGSLVLSNAAEPLAGHLRRLSSRSVTHLSGTPSHWRRVSMSPLAREIAPRYVRLSGEIADQSILSLIRSFYPHAVVGHAFASTEAGVAFEVNDGLEGFPADFLRILPDVDLKVSDSSLRIRSSRTATHVIGEQEFQLKDDAGFVDTGDIVELKDGRYHFLGRRSGLINVGGLKVYPEEIESLLNLHPAVRMSCVRARKNPITGSLVVAEVVLNDPVEATSHYVSQIKTEILKICRESLPRHKVPATIDFVPALNLASSGKVTRRDA
jgi:acyl-coenzyme A synthetase/AMP-(fatty) acid ligase